ncbi:MAG: MBL fold metallo-hydrolase [Chloroflexi bacterium]|nr:MBL fold metallo-hydrolase [Chloroflexota bacterium]
MTKLVVLGSSCAVPDETHENTHLALFGRQGLIMIDCAGQPVIRLRRAGIALEGVQDLILTHFHPDHVYGVPMLIMESWLRGRKSPLRLYGVPHCMSRMESLMQAYHWNEWPNLFPVSFHSVEEREGALVLDNADFRISAAPVKHFIPTIGLRIEDKETGRVLAYSCDTEPCPAVVKLAADADLLIHEATGHGAGHASAAEAGEMASEAWAKRLALIHYVTNGADTSRLVPEAQQTFDGPVTLAEDFMLLEF